MAPKIGIIATADHLSLSIPLFQSLHLPVTAIWCRNHDTCRSLATQFGVFLPAHSFQEVLLSHQVDLVYVATDPALRAEVTVKAMTSGKHCVCESPISVSPAEGNKIVNASRYYPQLLSMTECHLRFLPATLKMRELIKTGFCGTVLVVEAKIQMGSLIQAEPFSWKCDPSVGGGALSIVGSSIIDLITFTTQQRARRVNGYLKTFQPRTIAIHGYRTITGDDFCSIQAELEGQAFANITINTHMHGQYTFEFSVTGRDGILVLRGMDLFARKTATNIEKCLHKQETVDLTTARLPLKNYPAQYYQPLVIGWCQMLQALREDFEWFSGMLTATMEENEKIQRNLLPAATFEDGLYVLTVLDAVRRSSKLGRWEEVAEVVLADSTSYNPFWTSSDIRFNPAEKQSHSQHQHRTSLP